MSNFLNKSNISFKIAETEKNSDFNNNRVHCYYYGCVQLMFHILHKVLNMELKKIDENCNPKINVGNGGTHKWLHKYFSEDLNKKTYKIEGLDLNNHLGILKKLRTDADYGYNNIDIEGILKAKMLQIKIKKILNARYKYE